MGVGGGSLIRGFSGTRSINDSIFRKSFLTIGREWLVEQRRFVVSSSVVDGERDLFIDRCWCSWGYVGDIIGFVRWWIVGEQVLSDVVDDKLGVRWTWIESFSSWLCDSISI